MHALTELLLQWRAAQMSKPWASGCHFYSEAPSKVSASELRKREKLPEQPAGSRTEKQISDLGRRGRPQSELRCCAAPGRTEPGHARSQPYRHAGSRRRTLKLWVGGSNLLSICQNCQ